MYEEDTEIETWQWIVTIIVLAILIVIGIMVFSSDEKAVAETDKEYCFRIGRYTSVERLPAVCLLYFVNNK